VLTGLVVALLFDEDGVLKEDCLGEVVDLGGEDGDLAEVVGGSGELFD